MDLFRWFDKKNITEKYLFKKALKSFKKSKDEVDMEIMRHTNIPATEEAYNNISISPSKLSYITRYRQPHLTPRIPQNFAKL